MSLAILGKTPEELEGASRTYLLALNRGEMLAMQRHFSEMGREPTETELETIAQTWSEHCVHKTFRGKVVYPDGREIDSLFRSFIFKGTDELAMPWCVSVFEDNAGIIEFDEKNDLAIKVETHNHPTALDPYGGAGTGSGGVFRDVMGVGAKPILSTDNLFFGPPGLAHSKVPDGVIHPKRMMKGVVSGIRDYGNRMGIPTANGSITFHEGYTMNPLVYAGCLGIMPKGKYVRNAQPGDLILLVGGRTGRDGIHGVTFASLELTENSESVSGGAVQIGNAIEEKKVLDGLLRARDAEGGPLYSALTDCGGGGLSSAIGEMGKELGVQVELSKVPLKYEGLLPWEVWVSEAQERMILAVPEKNLARVLDIFINENAEATVIGRFTATKRLVLTFKGDVVCDLDMHFLHHGVPKVTRNAGGLQVSDGKNPEVDEEGYGKDLKKILSNPNVASKEWVIRQYDHEVQANTVIKPLHGFDGPGDSCVIKPVPDSWKGVSVSNGSNPRYSSNPYNMALSAIDEAIRNCVCVGGRRFALLDNFSWGNPEKPDRMAGLVEAVRACYDGCLGFKAPFISGKDSLYNEYSLKGDSHPIPGTIVVTAVGIVPDIRKAVTMDLKGEGNPVYVAGVTKDEMGGSHFFMERKLSGGSVPSVNMEKAVKTYNAVTKAMDSGIVKSCHDCSEGGLIVALAEMCIAGEMGMEADLRKTPSDGRLHEWTILFSESNSRLVLEIEKGKEGEFEKIMEDCDFGKIGHAVKTKKLMVKGTKGEIIISENVRFLKNAWQKTFRW